MKRLLIFALTFFISCSALAETPSNESIEKLLKLTRIETMLAATMENNGKIMDGAIEQMWQRRQFSPEKQELLRSIRDKYRAMLKEDLSWEKIKPIYLQIYSETFTQEEINGLIAFYESPVGHAVIEKMPLVLQKTSVYVKQILNNFMQRVEKTLKDAIAEPQQESEVQ